MRTAPPRGDYVSAMPCPRPGVLSRPAIQPTQARPTQAVLKQKAVGIRRKAAFVVESRDLRMKGISFVTGSELKQLRQDLGEAIGRPLSTADMAKLCGLEPKGGSDTIRRWEVTGPSGPADKLLTILAMASDRHPILENFNIFDRWDVDEKERPARRAAFRENMRDEIRERLA
jgi:DNA-binding transcriptional regulator YiaG